ncbi:hypothetical protein ASG43_06355 [Aureimonas sp. Leaf454]|uniref:hypothetical protein n=1 Tax=Aureimonas sp. Leaf454 TaxID=1736381 RepID=UPI0006F22BF6|nr:hypothetical protein [Aureimonas sp. Leaf454]KQT50876.1 hypothetical protein ASG43_06355 [Aureimonas sp. Leaf454]
MIGKRFAKFVLAFVTAVSCLCWDGELLQSGIGFFSQAEARIGRPATPLSYAGVARRTTRRVTRRAVAVGAATATTTRCTQVVNAYGQVITRCRR